VEVVAKHCDEYQSVSVREDITKTFIKMHKGRLTTYNASRANKINIV